MRYAADDDQPLHIPQEVHISIFIFLPLVSFERPVSLLSLISYADLLSVSTRSFSLGFYSSLAFLFTSVPYYDYGKKITYFELQTQLN